MIGCPFHITLLRQRHVQTKVRPVSQLSRAIQNLAMFALNSTGKALDHDRNQQSDYQCTVPNSSKPQAVDKERGSIANHSECASYREK